ncbi:MAG: STAS domain-containing protein [Pirellulales bacterium]
MSEITGTVTGRMEQDTLVAAVSLEQIRDALQTYALRDELQAMIESSKPRDVVVDMSNVKFIGSVGFLAFLSVRRQLTTGRIILANLSENLQKLFALCRLIPTEKASVAPFEVAADVAAALGRLT